MFCTLGMRHCRTYATSSKTDKCGRCGFNLEEYHRRIKDIRTNGLQETGYGIRRYVINRGEVSLT